MQYQLSFYVPENHLEMVKNTLFEIGAGKQGDYDQACWQCRGQGQFRPSSDANPAVGKAEELTYVNEYKVEMICSAEIIGLAVKALKKTHPYEEPAYAVIRKEEI